MDGGVKKQKGEDVGGGYGDTSVSRKRKESVVVVVAGLIRDGNEILNREEKTARA